MTTGEFNQEQLEDNIRELSKGMSVSFDGSLFILMSEYYAMDRESKTVAIAFSSKDIIGLMKYYSEIIKADKTLRNFLRDNR